METLAVHAARMCAADRSSSNLACRGFGPILHMLLQDLHCIVALSISVWSMSMAGRWTSLWEQSVCVCLSERNKALGLIQLDSTSFHQHGNILFFSYLHHLQMCYFLKFCQKAWHGPRGVILVEGADACWGLTLHSDSTGITWILRLWNRDVISWTWRMRRPTEGGRVACSRFCN